MVVNNIDTVEHTWVGQLVEAGEDYNVQEIEKIEWVNCEELKNDIINNKATINNLDRRESLVYMTGEIVPQDLDEHKLKKNKEIDTRTTELILQGFVYDSVLFSTSETAQRNWMALDQFKDDLTYPFAVSTKADGEYLVTDAIVAHNFVLTALGTIEYHYGTGRALKQQVNACVDQASVEAIQDNR
jgi:hypothetical protein